jgi:hypothetical protein
MSNQKPYIEDGQTISWPNEKRQKGKRVSSKHYTENYKLSKQTTLKTGGCSGTVTTSYSTSGTRHVTVT